MKRHLSLAVALLFAFGCPEAQCPDGQVVVEGACYPQEAVLAVGGGVPKLCAPACEGGAPHCDYHTGACVACRGDADCTDAAAPRCDASTHTCVACLENDECSSPDAPRCDETSHVCAGCASHDDCSGFSATPSCEPATSECVECTPDTEPSLCDGHSCNPATNTCTNTPVGSIATCGSCKSDSECGANMRCVHYEWEGFGVVENVCLYDNAAVSCANGPDHLRAPYVHPYATTTVTGVPVTVCRPPSTCFATLAYIAQKPCTVTSDCSNAPFAGVCMAASGAHPARCTLNCGDAASLSYYGCLFGDACGNLFCERTETSP